MDVSATRYAGNLLSYRIENLPADNSSTSTAGGLGDASLAFTGGLLTASTKIDMWS